MEIVLVHLFFFPVISPFVLIFTIVRFAFFHLFCCLRLSVDFSIQFSIRFRYKQVCARLNTFIDFFYQHSHRVAFYVHHHVHCLSKHKAQEKERKKCKLNSIIAVWCSWNYSFPNSLDVFVVMATTKENCEILTQISFLLKTGNSHIFFLFELEEVKEKQKNDPQRKKNISKSSKEANLLENQWYFFSELPRWRFIFNFTPYFSIR